jgi:DNA-binding LacI/PurR family transcriptional regulator
MLMQLINGETVNESYRLLDTELIIRDSCGAKIKSE